MGFSTQHAELSLKINSINLYERRAEKTVQGINEIKTWWRSRPRWRPLYSTHDWRMFSALVYKLKEAGIGVMTNTEISENSFPLQVGYDSDEYATPFYTIYVSESDFEDADELIYYLH